MIDNINTPQIIFIEGIHGSGKSTLAKAIAKEIKQKKPSAQLYLRSATPNPIDLCRLAYFSEKEFTHFLTTLSKETNSSKTDIYSELLPYVVKEQDKVVVNWYDYLSLINKDTPLSKSYALNHELCDGKAGVTQYINTSLNRWMKFSREIDEGGIYIFEGALLQHPLAELIGYYLLDDGEIASFIRNLIICIENIDKRLIYISVTDIKRVLLEAAIERNSKQDDWMHGFQKMVSTCNYGIKYGLNGIDGIVKYCTERIRVEKNLMKELGIPISIMERV